MKQRHYSKIGPTIAALAFTTNPAYSAIAVPTAPTPIIRIHLSEAERLINAADWSGLQTYATSLATEAGADSAEAAFALYMLAIALQLQGRWSDAVAPIRQAIDTNTKTLGPQSVDVAASLNNFVAMLKAPRLFSPKEQAYRRELEEKAQGSDQHALVKLMNKLASEVDLEGRYAEAEPIFRRALAIEGMSETEGSPDSATLMVNLAESLMHMLRAAEAERLLRQAIGIYDDYHGLESLKTIALDDLASLLANQGKYTDAEFMYRRSLLLRERTLRPDDILTAESLVNLADLLMQQDRLVDAELLYRRALPIYEKSKLFSGDRTVEVIDKLIRSIENSGRTKEMETLYRRSIAISEKLYGPNNPALTKKLDGLSSLMYSEGRYSEATALNQRAQAINAKALGSGSSHVEINPFARAVSLYELGRPTEAITSLSRTIASLDKRTAVDNFSALSDSLYSQGRYAEAAVLLQRAITSNEVVIGTDTPALASTLFKLAALQRKLDRVEESISLERRALEIVNSPHLAEDADTIYYLADIGGLLTGQGRFSEAIPILRRSLEIADKVFGPDYIEIGLLSKLLADALIRQGKNEEAEQLSRRALTITEGVFGEQSLVTADSLDDVANIVAKRGRFEDAEPLFRRALAIYENTFGPQFDSSHYRLELSYWLLVGRRYEEAATELRLGCIERQAAGAAGQNPEAAQAASLLARKARICSTAYSLSLWAWAAAGGGENPSDRPETLKAEAFLTAQRAEQSEAGDAIARSAALTAATSIGVGADAVAYEAALVKRDNADREIEKSNRDAHDFERSRAALLQSHDGAVTEIDRLASALKIEAPRYWDYRSPQPLSAAALQAKSGPDSILLRADEALLVFCTFPEDSGVPGGGQGLVFALSKELFAWARIGMTTNTLREHVARLRDQIDPHGYETRGVQVLPNERDHEAFGAFDRQASFELYQVLLGDASIQAVIKDKPTLLWVPSSLLASLPPGLLVTARPADGKARDEDAETLRTTPWLLRSKAISILPTVSSLRTLRQILPSTKPKTTDPLLAFVDPEFSHLPVSSKPENAQESIRGLATYFRGGHPLGDALAALPRLPGTRIEGEALMNALGARPESLLAGHDASKAELLARNADGRLAKVRVLEFATHGLVAGDASELAEPALVLAAGAKPEDELLLASEASTLKLNADWVLLSACNTASPEAPGAQGLSGLTRAFFFAGAKSLLVSHWSVRDDVGERLIPAMLRAEQKNPQLPHAQALQQASLAIMDDPQLNAASPSAWAPFTLVGEAER